MLYVLKVKSRCKPCMVMFREANNFKYDGVFTSQCITNLINNFGLALPCFFFAVQIFESYAFALACSSATLALFIYVKTIAQRSQRISRVGG